MLRKQTFVHKLDRNPRTFGFRETFNLERVYEPSRQDWNRRSIENFQNKSECYIDTSEGSAYIF